MTFIRFSSTARILSIYVFDWFVAQFTQIIFWEIASKMLYPCWHFDKPPGTFIFMSLTQWFSYLSQLAFYSFQFLVKKSFSGNLFQSCFENLTVFSVVTHTLELTVKVLDTYSFWNWKHYVGHAIEIVSQLFVRHKKNFRTFSLFLIQ